MKVDFLGAVGEVTGSKFFSNNPIGEKDFVGLWYVSRQRFGNRWDEQRFGI
jgi:hypothetical protein